MARVRTGRRIVAAAGAVMAAFAAACMQTAAAAGPCDLPITEAAQAIGALSGDTIELSDRRLLRLAAIAAPGTGLSEEPRAAVDAARTALDALVADRRILFSVVELSDRHGRILAHVALPGSSDPLSTEAALLANGHARLLPAADTCATSLRESEQAARDRRLGLWGDPHYAIVPAEQAAAFSGRGGDLIVAEGRLVSVNAAGSRFYLNFAERWKDGLSVTIWKGHLAEFSGGESDLRALTGSRVRVRGWLTGNLPGPLLAISGPGQIERVETERATEGR